MKITEALYIRLDELCRQKKLSTNKLAKLSKVSQSNLQRSHNRKRSCLTLITIGKLCKTLDISVVDFFKGEIFQDLEQEIE